MIEVTDAVRFDIPHTTDAAPLGYASCPLHPGTAQHHALIPVATAERSSQCSGATRSDDQLTGGSHESDPQQAFLIGAFLCTRGAGPSRLWRSHLDGRP